MVLVSYTSPLDLLDDALDALLSEPLSPLGAAELAERACHLEQAAARLDAARCAALARASTAPESPGVMSELGYRNTEQFVAHRSKAEPRSIRSASRLGRWLADFSALAAAFNNGNLSRSHLEELRKLDSERSRHALVRDQQLLIDTAASCDFTDFKSAVAYWSNAADPDGKLPREQVAATGLWYRRHGDGAVSGRFSFDPLTAQAFAGAVEAESQSLFRADAEIGKLRYPAKRDAEALHSLVLRGANSTSAAQVTPLINIVMSEAVAENLLQRIDDPSMPPIEVRYGDHDRRCEFIDGTPIHPNLALAALAVARLRRVVLGADGKPIEASVTSRGFPPWMKHLLLIEARGRCRAPGCDAPFPWLQADHVRPYVSGGPTKLSNGQILCDPHNKWKGARVY